MHRDAVTGDDNRQWGVFDYEVNMWRELRRMLSAENMCWPMFSTPLRNAVVESLVLHTRILIDLLLPKNGHREDDIVLQKLLPSFRSETLSVLGDAYGSDRQREHPHYAFNKMLAHATMDRRDSYDYSAALNKLAPLMEKLFEEITAARRCSAVRQSRGSKESE